MTTSTNKPTIEDMAVMGKPLTERQKVRRAVKADIRRQEKALGPLFASQAVAPDEDALLVVRRLRHARQVEHNREHLDGKYVLDALHERAVIDGLVRKHVPPEYAERLIAYRRKSLPESPSEYGLPFWFDVLSGRRVLLGVRITGQRQTPYGLVNTTEADYWPPPGWVPPFKREDFHGWTWARCKACGYYHAPGQQACEVVLEVKAAEEVTS